MAANYGKKFEQKLKEDFLKLEGISIDRLKDQKTGYKTVSKNISDFIIYKFPFIFYCEAKSIEKNTFPISNLTQYEELCTKIGIKGVKAGAVIWFIKHKKVVYVPIEAFKQMKEIEGVKSVHAFKQDYGKYGIIEIPSVPKRLFLDTDYKYLFNLWERELKDD